MGRLHGPGGARRGRLRIRIQSASRASVQARARVNIIITISLGIQSERFFLSNPPLSSTLPEGRRTKLRISAGFFLKPKNFIVSHG